jgi:hypothetical protein
MKVPLPDRIQIRDLSSIKSDISDEIISGLISLGDTIFDIYKIEQEGDYLYLIKIQ